MIDLNAWKEPSIEVVEYYRDAFDLHYKITDDEIFGLFEDMSIRQSDEIIKDRIHRINASYHTRVPVDPMCKNIKHIENLGRLIESGNSDGVVRIARCDDKQYFVFATKYCCFGNQKAYPIYDSLSVKVIEWLNKHGKRGPFYAKKSRLDNVRAEGYEGYRDIVKDFRTLYELEQFNYKELDQFLWLAGKNL